MLYFDGHCDILSKIGTPRELFSNAHHWDAERALSNGSFIQVFSLFAKGRNQSEIKSKMEEQLKRIHSAEKRYPEKFKIIRKSGDLNPFMALDRSPQLGCIVEAEGAEILGDSLEEMERVYDAGLRVLTLSWNVDNGVCDSIAGRRTHNGLSVFGRRVVKKAEAMGILIDVSHASDKTFADVAQMCTKPFIASHSNSRVLCSNKRNLTDEQIITIAERGGMIGVNLFPDFLHNSGNAHLVDIIKHIEYISALVSASYVGFGCDFDGIERLPRGIKGVENMAGIIEELLRLNYSEDIVKDIAGRNFAELFSKTLN